MTFGKLMQAVESIISDEGATKIELDYAKDLAESVNVIDKDSPDCGTGTGWWRRNEWRIQGEVRRWQAGLNLGTI